MLPWSSYNYYLYFTNKDRATKEVREFVQGYTAVFSPTFEFMHFISGVHILITTA